MIVMREIKFRAWDNVQEVMLSVENIDFRNDLITFNEDDNSLTDTFEMITLMQYTGMKDKNGKEIYEGDIVGHLNMRAEIIFENGSFEFKWLDKITKRVRRYNEPMFKNTSITFEVIGNIYENKELLEESK